MMLRAESVADVREHDTVADSREDDDHDTMRTRIRAYSTIPCPRSSEPPSTSSNRVNANSRKRITWDCLWHLLSTDDLRSRCETDLNVAEMGRDNCSYHHRPASSVSTGKHAGIPDPVAVAASSGSNLLAYRAHSSCIWSALQATAGLCRHPTADRIPGDEGGSP